MNILIINHYAGNPDLGMEFRPYYLSKEWLKSGHNVSIIASSFSHLRTRQPKADKDLFEENIDGIKYIWIKTPAYKSSGVRRCINIFAFVIKLIWYRKRILKMFKPDAVIASSTYPLDIFPAYMFSKTNNAKLCFELHDMWPLTPMIIGGYSQYHPFIWMMQKAENFACRNSDCYVSMLGNTQEYLVEHGLNPRKFTYITNGFLEDDWFNNTEEIPAEHLSLFERLKKENKIIIGYAGGHSPSNALGALINVAMSINDEKYAFVLIGKGPIKEELIAKAKNFNLNNVFFLPAVSMASIPNLLKHFDIAFIAGVKSNLHKYGTAANKVTDYMLAEKPIIFAVDEPNSLVEKIGCGIQIPAEDETELIKAIKRMSFLSKEQRCEMGRKGREYVIKELNYSVLSKKFIQAIEQS
jgi:glycosyltransferase involved in cell wall biosynthesis